MQLFKKYNQVILLIFLIGFSSCENIFEDRKDTTLNEDQVFKTYDRVMQLGYNTYNYISDGYNAIDGAYLAGASDEGEHSWDDSKIRLFNEGSWSQYDNPDNKWHTMYDGIRNANLFLENSVNIQHFMVADTFTATDKFAYNRKILDLDFLRAEVQFLRAYFHFELLKRYGPIPIVSETLAPEKGIKIERADYDSCISFIVSECDSLSSKVLPTFKYFNNSREGRVTTGLVLALKSRVLLCAASPLNNPSRDPSKWLAAAEAANEFITFNSNLKLYGLHKNYGELFIPPNCYNSPEVIWSFRLGEGNSIERANYPIGTDGGNSGTCPSHNLVNAYEKLDGWVEDEPYELRDPRLNMTVVVNNANWNSRNIEIWPGGRDMSKNGLSGATKTGYYLKKFLVDNLNLSLGQTARHAWIEFRYAEILLNYAEAVNEAFGFDETPAGFSMSARRALNLVRSRSKMPAVEASNQDELRERVMHERRVELAFEGHRFWDARRWMEGESILGSPLMGVRAEKVNDNVFNYTEFKVEDRVFKSNMYYYPIPQSELIKYDGTMSQNDGW